MLHGWKVQDINVEVCFDYLSNEINLLTQGWESPFEKLPNLTECGIGSNGWSWREKKKADVQWVREILAEFERSTARSYPKEARVSFRLSFHSINKHFRSIHI